MTERGRAAAIVAAVFVVDRITKAYIRSSFSAWDITPVIPRFFNIVHTENPGAAFGMLSDSTGLWRQLFRCEGCSDLQQRGRFAGNAVHGGRARQGQPSWKSHQPNGTNGIGEFGPDHVTQIDLPVANMPADNRAIMERSEVTGDS